jgi:phosphonate transport system substrate-binding protein
VLFLVLTLALSGCDGGELGTEDNPIIMSFALPAENREIMAGGEKVAQAISGETGLTIQVTSGVDYAAVREAMGAGQVHIGWLDAFNYILANEEHGVAVALVTERMGATSYRGQLNVHVGSGIGSLQDLKGKVMCWVDPMTASGYIIPRITLQANGIDPDADFARTVEAGSHENVITQVYYGNCDVGATYVDARSSVEKEIADVKDVVIVLDTTAAVPNDSISFGKDFPEDLRQEIVNALLAYAGTEEGRAALNAFYAIDGVRGAEDAIYDGFRAELGRSGVNVEELAK